MRKPVLWVVEMRVRDRWEPTVGVGLTREAGRRNLDDWSANNSGHQFRMTTYCPAPPAKEEPRE